MSITTGISINASGQTPAAYNTSIKYQLDTAYVTGKTKTGTNPVRHTAENAVLKRMADYILYNHIWDSTNFGGSAINISNASLTWNGNYTQNVNQKALVFDSVKYFRISDSTGIDIVSTPASGANQFGVSHLAGLYTLTGIAAGPGAGTAPTITVAASSTDLAGYVSVTTGTGCATSSIVATLTFAKPFSTAPMVFLVPGNAATAALTVVKQCFVDQTTGTTTTTFDISSNTTALTDATPYLWKYLIIGR